MVIMHIMQAKNAPVFTLASIKSLEEKLRQKELPPETKVHLCRITHLLKLEYQDYLDVAEFIEIDITT